jgi:lantibiotic modifying enzyme
MTSSEILENEDLFNKIIYWINSQKDKEHTLNARKMLCCGRYGFVKYTDLIDYKNTVEQEFNYYFYLGQLLTLLYVLDCRNFRSSDISNLSQYPVIKNVRNLFVSSKEKLCCEFSSKNIARDILDASVYKIDFLPESKKDKAEKYIDSIKSGFEYTYNLIRNNKQEFTNLITSLFSSKPVYLSNVQLKIYGLTKDNLKRQLYFLDVRFIKKENEKTNISFSNNINPTKTDKDQLMAIATQLGNHIIQKGIIGFKDNIISRTWISTVKKGEEFILYPDSYNLGEGNSGIAIFLLYLGVATKKDYFINVALEAMQGSSFHIDSFSDQGQVKMGAFKGVSGEIYALSKIYSITKNEDIKEALKKGIYKMHTLIDNETYVNVSGGFAGVMAVLLAIYENNDHRDLKKEVFELAKEAYKKLINNMKLINFSEGFCDGSDGIIAVLARLLHITGNKEIEETIKEILDFQRKRCVEERLNVSSDWNQGYSGMLLSRLILKESSYEDELIDTEIKEALEYTMINGFGNSPYYYNGDIASLEMLEYAANVLKDGSLKNRCTNTFNKMVEEVIKPSIVDEINFGNKSLSFMTGLAGAGYSLLRRCSDVLVPQVLWLQ